MLTIAAIILGPILAVQAQAWLDRRREERRRKLHVFAELMATRGTRLAPRHVEALNLIELEYSEKNDKQRPVLEAWRSYIDLLNNPPSEEQNLQAHFDRRDQALVDLLYQMGRYLGFAIDRVVIRRNAYTPEGHGQADVEWNIIRKGFAKLLINKQHALPIQIVKANFEGPPVMTLGDAYRPIKPEGPTPAPSPAASPAADVPRSPTEAQ